MKKRILLCAVCIISFFFLCQLAHAQHTNGDYRETVLNIPGLDSDKTYHAIEQLYKNTPGVEIMLRCKRGEMLVIKTDTRIQPDTDKLLRRITENNFKATVLDGFDYNKAVATCSDYKPD